MIEIALWILGIIALLIIAPLAVMGVVQWLAYRQIKRGRPHE